MNPELKAEWVKRLLSGQYKQTNNVLYRVEEGNGKAYCCLGVLANILVEQGQARWESDHSHIQTLVIEDEDDGDVLRDAAELGRPGRMLTGLTEKQESHAIHLNDTKRWTFNQIAAWIIGGMPLDD